MTNYTPIEKQIQELYKELLEREPDPDGLRSWVKEVKRTGDLQSVIDGIKQSIEYKNLCNLHNRVNYYAELETDRIVRENYFPDFAYKGVIVEVGAATPEFLSMSKHFRETGWRCICIEPNPKYVEMHKNSQSEVYQFACSSSDKDNVDFQIAHFSNNYDSNEITDHSYSALQIKDNYLTHGNIRIESIPIITIKVNVRTLNTLLTELQIDHIDLLSVDTEGWELEVMRGFDADKFQPKVIVLENWTYLPEYVEYMQSIGYILDRKVEYNFLFVRGT